MQLGSGGDKLTALLSSVVTHSVENYNAVRVGLRLLEEYETKREALRQALKEGEDSGIAPYTLHDLLDGLDDGDLESMNVEKYF